MSVCACVHLWMLLYVSVRGFIIAPPARQMKINMFIRLFCLICRFGPVWAVFQCFFCVFLCFFGVFQRYMHIPFVVAHHRTKSVCFALSPAHFKQEGLHELQAQIRNNGTSVHIETLKNEQYI